MIDDVGIFRTTLGVAALFAPDRRKELADVMVDTGSEYSWVASPVLIELGIAPVRIDRFETADRRVLEREVGFALLYAGGRSTATIVAGHRVPHAGGLLAASCRLTPTLARRSDR